jgi:hypothetical protein
MSADRLIRKAMRILWLPPLVILFAQMAHGQTTGIIEGTVTDPSQSAIPGADVKVVNQRTGVESSTTTNATGYFRFDGLPVGVYDISVNHAGFRAYSVKGLKLDAASRVRHNISLAVGAITESVTVQAAAVQVDTSQGTVSSTVTREQIETAVLNGRHYSRLAMMMPGAVYHSSGDELSGAGLNATGSPVSINGLNNKSAGWFVDGALDVNFGNGEANTHIPVIDSLDEVQVQTANYSARYGTAGGAVINAVTRSGTKDFHGSAYEYFRNDKLDARNFFAAAPPPLKQNQYGFTFGGPVLLPHYNKDRNKTFFFWSEDWRKRRNATTSITTTPNDAIRAGNFAAEAARIGKSILDPTNAQPFAGNQIPASRINANAALLMKTYLPAPNYSGEVFRNYINNGVAKTDPRTDTVKVDHNLTDRIRLSFTFSNDDIEALAADAGLGGSPFPVFRQGESTSGKAINARATFTLTPRTTNEFYWSSKKFDVNLQFVPDTASPTRPAGLTIRDFFQGANVLNMTPTVSFSQGWGGIGTNMLPLKPAKDNNDIFADNFSHVYGNHTIQLGISLFRYEKTQASFNYTQGNFSFDGTFTNHPIADFMLGRARTYSQGKELYVRSYRFLQTEWYAQDDWRVTRKLTMNLGLRVFVIPMTHVDGNLMSSFLPSKFVPANAPAINASGVLVPGPTYDPLNGIVLPEKEGVPRGFANTFYGYAPRFGFAYDPTGNGKFAIRGGYGVSYLNVGNNQSSLVQNPPFNVNIALQNVPLDDPSGGTPNAPRPVSLSAFDPNFKRPMIHSWSLTLQKELPGQFLASAGYVGTRGTNWEVWIDRNAPDFGAPVPGYDFDPRLNAGYNSNLLRPYQGYSGITWFSSGLDSIYHSLQTTFQRRFSSGLALQGTYTWSKVLGQSQTRRDMRVQNPKNWKADRGPSDFDRTHVFGLNYIYQLPFLHNRRDILGQAFGNWQVSGILALQSGLAMTPGLALSTAGLATRPNATGVPAAGPKTKTSWFNTAAFTAPPTGKYGNAGVGVLRGPGFFIWDSAVSKQFPIWEQTKLSFNAEFFNFLNHTNWSGVSTALGSGTYGQVTSARDPRKIQLSLKLQF